MTNEKLYHSIGKRDALAEILMMFRNGDSYEKTILELAKQLPDNPHAQYFIKSLK